MNANQIDQNGDGSKLRYPVNDFELGVHPDTLVVGEAGDRVGVLLPAEVAELLTAKAVELEEIKGGDW